MASRRAQKVAEAIREVVSMAILADLKDPRVRGVTVTYVEVSDDLRYAKVHVSVMGDEKTQNLTFHGLESAGGYLQSKIAKRLELRYTPRLTFVLDQGVKRSIEVAKILQRVLPQPPDEQLDDELAEEDAGEGEAPDETASGDESAGAERGAPAADAAGEASDRAESGDADDDDGSRS